MLGRLWIAFEHSWDHQERLSQAPSELKKGSRKPKRAPREPQERAKVAKTLVFTNMRFVLFLAIVLWPLRLAKESQDGSRVSREA